MQSLAGLSHPLTLFIVISVCENDICVILKDKKYEARMYIHLTYALIIRNNLKIIKYLNINLENITLTRPYPFQEPKFDIIYLRC